MDLDKDLRELDAQTQERASDLLPIIWAGIERKRSESALSKLLLTWQTSVLAVAVVASVAVGAQTVPVTPGRLGVFSPHGPLAPSTLLSGHNP